MTEVSDWMARTMLAAHVRTEISHPSSASGRQVLEGQTDQILK